MGHVLMETSRDGVLAAMGLDPIGGASTKMYCSPASVLCLTPGMAFPEYSAGSLTTSLRGHCRLFTTTCSAELLVPVEGEQ